MTISTVIVDDNKAAAEILNEVLLQYPEIKVQATCHTKDEAIKQIKDHRPNLVFMDIEINKDSGFDVLDNVEGFYDMVVITTAYTKYSLEAFNYEAIHFLLKPIDLNILHTTIQRVKKHNFQSAESAVNLKTEMLDFYNQTNKLPKKIFLYENNLYKGINADEILYIEANGNYSIIETTTEKINTAKNLSALSNLLMNNPNLMRVHKSYIVNLNYVKDIVRGVKSEAILTNGVKIPISLTSKKDFLERFKIIG